MSTTCLHRGIRSLILPMGSASCALKPESSTTWRNWRGDCDKAATNPCRPGACISPQAMAKRLGYRCAGGRCYVRPKSLKALRDKIRQKTGRARSGSLDFIIAELNPTLRGWFGYFKHAISGTFRTIDSFVRRRLRAILRKRENRMHGSEGGRRITSRPLSTQVSQGSVRGRLWAPLVNVQTPHVPNSYGLLLDLIRS
jgi:hypothetical protein